jgi:PAS domain S-box-containing protein
MTQTSRTRIFNAVIAVGCVILAISLRLLLDPVFGDKFPFATMFLAVMVVSRYCGFWPAVGALSLGAVAGVRFILPPRDSFHVEGFENRAAVIVYFILGFVLASLGESMRRAHRKLETSARRAREKQIELEQAMEERQNAEMQLQVTLQSIGDAVISTDITGQVVFMNPIAQKMTGWSAVEAQGKPLVEVFRIVNETTRQPVENPAMRALQQGAIIGLANHTVLIDKSGVERPIDDSAAPIRDSHGAIIGSVLVFRDIGARKRAEAELRESESRKAAILKASLDAIITFDAKGRITAFNPAAVTLFGYTEAEAIGRDAHKMIVSENTDTATRSSSKTVLRRRIEAPAQRKDGTSITVEFAIAPLEGEQRFFTAFIRDITERKKAERIAEFLARASASLATIVDSDSTLQKVASLAVPAFADWATVDLLEGESHLRRVAVCHVDPTKVELARDIHRRFPIDPAKDQWVWKILRSGRPSIVSEVTDDMLVRSIPDAEKLRLLRTLGLKSYVGVPLKVRGKPLGVISFVVAESNRQFDATDLAAAEDLAHRAGTAIENAQLYLELRQADRRKDEFLATLAHELRNPLAPIRNALQVMGMDGVDRRGLEESRAMIERQVVQMVRLVDDLLDMNRITRNKLELRRERVVLSAVIASAVETSKPLIELLKHRLEVRLPPEPISLIADGTRLSQIFSNLLNNSAKYTNPGGTIEISAAMEGDDVSVRVRDNGIGIPKESLAELFEMFSQVDRNLERAQGGLGIGLTLVRRLVEMHGGTVEAHSEGLGKGSVFTVKLPLSQPATGGSNAELEIFPAAIGHSPSSARRILVVDDNKDSAISLGMLLTLMGNVTRTAHDGLEAFDVASEFRPDLVLLDIGMPKLNGYDTCRKMRAEEWAKGITIVALTGWGQEEDRRRSAEAGFDHHMIKPVDPEALQRLLAAPK